MKLARITSLIILSLIITVSCNTGEVKKDSQLPAGVEEISQTAYISMGQSYEECIELYPNQVMHYSFKASQNVNFNIHYHGMEGRKYAIKKNEISSFSGELVCNEMSFYDKEQENFCMIWTNLNESDAKLNLKYYITLRAAPDDAK
jgi:hypothetical protein